MDGPGASRLRALDFKVYRVVGVRSHGTGVTNVEGGDSAWKSESSETSLALDPGDPRAPVT